MSTGSVEKGEEVHTQFSLSQTTSDLRPFSKTNLSEGKQVFSLRFENYFVIRQVFTNRFKKINIPHAFSKPRRALWTGVPLFHPYSFNPLSFNPDLFTPESFNPSIF